MNIRLVTKWNSHLFSKRKCAIAWNYGNMQKENSLQAYELNLTNQRLNPSCLVHCRRNFNRPVPIVRHTSKGMHAHAKTL